MNWAQRASNRCRRAGGVFEGGPIPRFFFAGVHGHGTPFGHRNSRSSLSRDGNYGPKCDGITAIFAEATIRAVVCKARRPRVWLRAAGGLVSSGISKKTTHLIIKEELPEGKEPSGKMKKAADAGIQVLTGNDLLNLIGA